MHRTHMTTDDSFINFSQTESVTKTTNHRPNQVKLSQEINQDNSHLFIDKQQGH